jgi:chitinase
MTRAAMFISCAALLAPALRADPVLMSYFNSGDGALLAGAAHTDYTDIAVAFLLPDPGTNQLGFDAIGTTMYGSVITTPVAQAIRSLQADGKKVLLSFGGSTVTSAQYAALDGNIPALASDIAGMVKNATAADGLPLHFDGVDIDWENTEAFINPAAAGYDGVHFLTNLTTDLRAEANLPSSAGWLLTHAPQPPYLSKDPEWSSGGYGKYATVLNAVGSQFDWINVQDYNNPGFATAAEAVANYNDIVSGWSGIPGVPDFNGLPSSKIVIGKPDLARPGESGWLSATEVRDDIVTPLVSTYGANFGGVFSWELTDDPNGAWAATVAQAFPVPEPSAKTLLLLAGVTGVGIWLTRAFVLRSRTHAPAQV